MKKIIASLLSVFLVLPACAMNVPKKMENSTVLLKMKIHDTKENKSGWGFCSGVYVKNHIILSAAHCTEVPEGMEVKEVWIRKGNDTAKATVIKVDTTLDLVLLYTPVKGTPVKLARKVVRGEECWVIGNPLGIINVVTKGIVSKLNFKMRRSEATFIVVDSVVLPGNSGGAIVNKHGHLIGILTRSTSIFGIFGASGLGFGVDLNSIGKFLKRV